MSNRRKWEGNRAKALTREFERNYPFEEIYPPRLTDSLGHDVLQNTLQMCASNYESRFDHLPGIVGPLTNLYQLRQQAGAEEWPVPSEPLIDEDGVPVKLMVIPSKANLLKHAQPLDRMHLNKNIRTLVVDRAIKKEFEKAVSDRLVPFCDLVVFEFTQHASGVLIALDGSNQFCGSYSLPGGAHQLSPTAPPAGGEVTVALHEIAAIGASILFSTWIAARFLALSISQ